MAHAHLKSFRDQSEGKFGAFAPPEARAHSPEREPWRFFKSSPAIGFRSKARRSWTPEKLAPEVRASILGAIEASRSIAASNAFLHTGMRRFLRAANEQGSVGALPALWKQTDTDVRRLTWKVVGEVGLPMRDSDALASMISKLEAEMPRIELLAHGTIEVVEEQSWAMMVEFSLHGRRGKWTPDDVEAEALEFAPLAADALEMFDRASELLERTREQAHSR